MSPRSAFVTALLVYVTACIVQGAPITARPASTTLPASVAVRCQLSTTPDDALFARQLRIQNPRLTPSELALRTPLSEDHHRLIRWMHADLGQYVAHHEDVWRQRLECRPELAKIPPKDWKEEDLDPHDARNKVRDARGNVKFARYGLFDRAGARDALDLFADAVRPGLHDLTLADFHRLVSVFASPDHYPKSYISTWMAATDPESRTVFYKLWPTQAFLFTTEEGDDFGRLAMAYGLGLHYLSLRSHLDLKKSPQGEVMLPCELLRAGLTHARLSRAFLHPDDDWPAIHQAYMAMQDASGRTGPQRQIDDLVYFYHTHEMYGYAPDRVLSSTITMTLRPWLMKVAGPENWTDLLQNAVDHVRRFWRAHVPSARDPMWDSLPESENKYDLYAPPRYDD